MWDVSDHFILIYITSRMLNKSVTCIIIIDCTPRCLSNGTPKTINFPFVPNGKFMGLGVPILKHIRVSRLVVIGPFQLNRHGNVVFFHSFPDSSN